MADRQLPKEPAVPLKLPGGLLNVVVETPSGLVVQDLGTHPLLQIRTGQGATSGGLVIKDSGGHPDDVLQLTTLDDRLVYRFAEYGRYKIKISGSVPDIRGNEYLLSDTFELWAAETLDVETAALPGTPFQVGDQLPATINVYPGVPATVKMSYELHPIDGSAPVAGSVGGEANRFGYFDGSGNTFNFDRAGEYVVRVTASYTDSDGRLWMGVRRWGSAVATRSPELVAHGRRGDDSQPLAEQRAWFSRQTIGISPGESHISFPYHSGDVVWVVDDDSVGMPLTVQDLGGRVAALLEERAEFTPEVRQRGLTGDLPLDISTSNGLPPTFAVDAIDQWAYAYVSVQRPGVRVREMVATEATHGPYWRFQDLYLGQRGMGAEGDLPNDIKWLFGAAVFKRPDLGVEEVAIYGSLWVEISDDDPRGSRVFPPFRGAAGGPDGGPIMTLKGEEIDLFLLPTAVRPGAILTVGDRFVFAGQVGVTIRAVSSTGSEHGQVGPPLASEVTIRAVSSTGSEHVAAGVATLIRAGAGQHRRQAIGYFSSPEDDFVVHEPGVWTVHVAVHHDGPTSAGTVQPPYPTGSVLGSVDGTYHFYVVPAASTSLDIDLPATGIIDPGIERPFALGQTGSITSEPGQVIAGSASIKGGGGGPDTESVYLRTDQTTLALLPKHTYEVAFDY